jgi:predicted transcriptional regulator
MLTALFGSENAEKVLQFLNIRSSGYPREIAKYYDIDVYAVQNQLEKFELGGLVISRLVGRTRVYEFNPRYAFLSELKTLLEKAFQFYPPEEIERLNMNRRRPRRAGKPL